MVGETLSTQHIADLPTILPIDGNPAGKVYYIGGMNVIRKFTSSKSAAAFYENENNWNRWFKWLKMGFNDEMVQERITWIRILSLPICFRSMEVFAKLVWYSDDETNSTSHDGPMQVTEAPEEGEIIEESGEHDVPVTGGKDRCESHDKRRRIISTKLCPVGGKSVSLQPQQPSRDCNLHDIHPSSAPLFDLNTTASIIESNIDPSCEASESLSCEINSVVKIGKDVRFQIDEDDPVVAGIANNGGGVHTMLQ
ncbi:hypothetical protein L2E82_28633 [Cichorium intybus]|uniref:Uncharacterized protein n=1 Tax=Cichorium intybus TaxID=13427 RepID=A0ACB9CWM2_CICIN|nr:hypothetical protein L2E82_28633 [Cichorium intybus]